ncbi:uracil-DNA glycosylase [Anaerococcus hydrogenalis]|uniref:Uracil-DNA glycosylase n=2 Tax=Anaerococcus hydrogenalis TaxID=33029 RepID=F0GZE1_9FIRM|nr:uracil-DNA glycosylase [Anaerococcus hydrogenalis]EGC84412.1 uracil-DNA glycosylase [Anaerococcus hydrogenalis ACS-025-V-Sch4]MBS5988420.1 uracil-DNA glycosylase [Anaerococcus hydrogenalis]MDK7694522.1 uracil-DNA glycosylase [Anaerococcus hydrogenalis]MDK7696300.1 uracil-DNA glycosylase [Anaerococcus hydrogenalis]MDK7707549.1 uracil-DNA glycosylase [Anaerococcus hydrogenalis]
MSVQIGNDWDDILKDEWTKDYYINLRKKLIDEYKNYTVYPNMYDIFNALKKVSYDDVKVVILGQDPYHGQGQAHGFSFSVKKGIKTPPSLQNIYKELHSDLGLYIPNNGNLIKWANQGVLLLNSTLTVRAHQANSHKDLGWSILTDNIIKILNKRSKPIVFILWGKFAQSKEELITNDRHLIIKSAHPSPFAAHRGFFGSRPFSKTNEFLQKNNIKPIDWQIENLDL